MQLRIGTYLRVSTEEQAQAVEGSLDNQKYRLKSFIEIRNSQEKGWGKVVETYADEGLSAKDTKRPGYQKMMADIKKGKINLIMVTDLSRLSRNIYDFCNLLNDLEKYKAKFLSIKEQFDSSTPSGKMMIYNMINLAQFEREQISERVALGCHSRAMRGFMNGGRSILGFDKSKENSGVYIVNEEEAKTVKKIFKTFIECESRAKTIQRLKEMGIQPKPNTNRARYHKPLQWNAQTLGNILNASAYLGFHEVNKQNKNADSSELKPWQRYQVVKASWPAIIDQATFDRAHSLLEEAKKLERVRLSGAERRFYLLTGILRCGECGGPLVGQAAHGQISQHRYYGHANSDRGNGCRKQRVVAHVVEDAVIQHLSEGLQGAGYFQNVEKRIIENASGDLDSTKKELKRVEKRLSEIALETSNIFRLQGQMNMDEGALQLASDRLGEVAKEKAGLTKYRSELMEKGIEAESYEEQSEFLKDSIADFNRGFKKAPETLKRRLLRETIQQLVLTSEGLAIWYYLADAKIPGNKLQLVKELKKGPEGTETEVLFLVPRASGDHSNLQVLSSDIGKNGDPTPT